MLNTENQVNQCPDCAQNMETKTSGGQQYWECAHCIYDSACLVLYTSDGTNWYRGNAETVFSKDDLTEIRLAGTIIGGYSHGNDQLVYDAENDVLTDTIGSTFVKLEPGVFEKC